MDSTSKKLAEEILTWFDTSEWLDDKGEQTPLSDEATQAILDLAYRLAVRLTGGV